MEFTIIQKELNEILNYSMLGGTFSFCPFEVKKYENGTALRSLQSNENNTVFKYARFNKDYFKSLSSEEETIYLNAEKLQKIIQREDADAIIHAHTEGDEKFVVEGARSKTTLNLIENIAGARSKLPFKIDKDGMVTFPKIAGALENKVTMGTKSFKTIVEYAGILETGKYKFQIDQNKKFVVRIGELEKHKEFTVYEPQATIDRYKSPVTCVISLAMKEMAHTFLNDISVQMTTGQPAFFSEESHKHKFGVVVSPYDESQAGN